MVVEDPAGSGGGIGPRPVEAVGSGLQQGFLMGDGRGVSLADAVEEVADGGAVPVGKRTAQPLPVFHNRCEHLLLFPCVGQEAPFLF